MAMTPRNRGRLLGTTVDATTPSDTEQGDRVNMPAPKNPPFRAVLMWNRAKVGLEWRAATSPAKAPETDV